MTPSPTTLRVDVADLLTHPAARRPVTLRVPLTGLEGSAARIAADEPVELDLVLERVPDGIVVRGTIGARWRAECSTCLRELEQMVELPVNELFEPDPLEGDTYPLEGHELDLEQLVRDTILLELPLAPTCAAAGAGPCADDVPHADEDTSPDPRWRVLSELEL
jgi:uncharacterized protein